VLVGSAELASNAELGGDALRVVWGRHVHRWHIGRVAQRVGGVSGRPTLRLERSCKYKLALMLKENIYLTMWSP
jgi:hypothetical protein